MNKSTEELMRLNEMKTHVKQSLTSLSQTKNMMDSIEEMANVVTEPLPKSISILRKMRNDLLNSRKSILEATLQEFDKEIAIYEEILNQKPETNAKS